MYGFMYMLGRQPGVDITAFPVHRLGYLVVCADLQVDNWLFAFE